MTMTKEEQLRKVFTKEIEALVSDKTVAIIENTIYPISELVDRVVNKLIYEVKIRTKLTDEEYVNNLTRGVKEEIENIMNKVQSRWFYEWFRYIKRRV